MVFALYQIRGLEFYTAIRIKTYLDNTLYLSSLWSDLSCAAELVIGDCKSWLQTTIVNLLTSRAINYPLTALPDLHLHRHQCHYQSTRVLDKQLSPHPQIYCNS